jgi:hypothetical protein
VAPSRGDPRSRREGQDDGIDLTVLDQDLRPVLAAAAKRIGDDAQMLGALVAQRHRQAVGIAVPNPKPGDGDSRTVGNIGDGGIRRVE